MRKLSERGPKLKKLMKWTGINALRRREYEKVSIYLRICKVKEELNVECRRKLFHLGSNLLANENMGSTSYKVVKIILGCGQNKAARLVQSKWEGAFEFPRGWEQ